MAGRRTRAGGPRAIALAAVVGVLVAGLGVAGSTDAGFTTTTNASASWSAGAVGLSDDDGGSALLSVTGLVPGATGTRCITVTYSGTVAADVRLYATALAGSLAPYLDLTVDLGTGSTAGGSCAAFTQTTRLFTGTLTALGAASSGWATGLPGFYPTGPGASAAYRVGYTLNAATPDSAQGATGSATLRWEARDTTASAGYTAAVLADSPFLYYRLGEGAAPTAADASGNGRTGTYALGAGESLGVTGAVGGDTAVRLKGTSDATVSSAAAFANPDVFTTEIWFRSTTTTSGMLWGMGDGTSDVRYLYMQDDGKLIFRGLLNADDYGLVTPAAYNDGAWHLVAVSMGAAGVRILVDGALVASDAYTAADVFSAPWFVGAGTTYAWWDSGSTTRRFTGDLDEFAVYPTQLADARVAAHYAAH